MVDLTESGGVISAVKLVIAMFFTALLLANVRSLAYSTVTKSTAAAIVYQARKGRAVMLQPKASRKRPY